MITHGSLVSSVLGAIGTLRAGLPMVMDVGELCSEILAYHPQLVGPRVHNHVHPSFVDRNLSSVLFLFLKHL
jgi:hypothetical protein